MINLLPPDVKDSYRYARRNVLMRRWIFNFILAFVGLGLISTYGLVSLSQSETIYKDKIAEVQSVYIKEKYAETETQINDMSNSFKLVVQVLSKEVRFSELLKQIAALIPAKANLTGLTINQTKGGIDISANAIDYSTAAQLQINLSDTNNKIFSKADIVTASCSSTAVLNTDYPCSVNIRALFAPNSPFLLINSKKATL